MYFILTLPCSLVLAGVYPDPAARRNVGDLLTKPHADGGFNLSRISSSAIITIFIIALFCSRPTSRPSSGTARVRAHEDQARTSVNCGMMIVYLSQTYGQRRRPLRSGTWRCWRHTPVRWEFPYERKSQPDIPVSLVAVRVMYCYTMA